MRDIKGATANPVTELMRQRKISPLPRNYELFYEALHGSNARLSGELIALGVQPFQSQLDELFTKYIGELRKSPQLDTIQDGIYSELEGLLKLLSREKDALEVHGASLTEFSRMLSTGDRRSLNDLGRAIGEIRTMTSRTMQTHDGITDDASKSAAELAEMRAKLNEYKRLAYIDSLTGLFNRRAFDDRIGTAYARSGRMNQCALILADIDHFKHFNDTYGHPAGDKILTAVGRTLAKFANRAVFVARPGGEEFALIAENTLLPEAIRLAELARIEVEKILLESGGGKNVKPVTISLGVSVTPDAADAAEFYRNSDMALYAAKNTGRNCVRVYDAQLPGKLSENRLMYKATA